MCFRSWLPTSSLSEKAFGTFAKALALGVDGGGWNGSK
jgi:hypothetical protein